MHHEQPQQSGYPQKALVVKKKPVTVYKWPDVGLTKIKQKGSGLVPTTANYSRFYN